jgi:hypothetical protein
VTVLPVPVVEQLELGQPGHWQGPGKNPAMIDGSPGPGAWVAPASIIIIMRHSESGLRLPVGRGSILLLLLVVVLLLAVPMFTGSLPVTPQVEEADSEVFNLQ